MSKEGTLFSRYDLVNKYLSDNEITFFLDYDISRRSYIKAGGICKLFIQPHSINHFINLIIFFHKEGLPYKIVGNLSNIVFQSGNISTIIVSTQKLRRHCYLDDNEYYAETGVSLPMLSRNLSRDGYEGFSGLVGIPGTVGGAVFMNAGAYGYEISDNIKYVTCLNDKNEVCTILKGDLSFGWRTSAFHNIHKEYKILSAVFRLKTGDIKSIKTNMDKAIIHRKTYQENNYPNLGSTFATKDIYGDLSRHFVLYRLGNIIIKIFTKIYHGDRDTIYANLMNRFSQRYFHLKPTNNVGFSDKSFNCVINKGGASATEIIEFIKRTQSGIKYKIPLEVEIFKDQF